MKKEDIKTTAFCVGYCFFWCVVVALGIRFFEIIFSPRYHHTPWPIGGVLTVAAVIAGGIVITKLRRWMRKNDQLRQWARANKPAPGVYHPIVLNEWKKIGLLPTGREGE